MEKLVGDQDLAFQEHFYRYLFKYAFSLAIVA